jgi:hypothetical protein
MLVVAQVQQDIDVKKLLKYSPPEPTMFDDGSGTVAKVRLYGAWLAII